MGSFQIRLAPAWRRLARAPLFTLVVVVTLAVGIGANTAIFSVVNGVLLKPLPFADAERLVGVWHTAPGAGMDIMNQSPALHLIYREHSRVFEDIGMWSGGSSSVTGIGEPERVRTLVVTAGILPVLSVEPLLGRRFTEQDDAPGSAHTVMLSHAYWQRKFGGDPSVVGRPIVVNGISREVIGVLPPQFRFLNQDSALVLPQQLDRAQVFIGNFSYQAIARLKPGVTLEQANADVARMIPLVFESFPLPPGFTRAMLEEVRLGPNVRPLEQDVVGNVGHLLWVLLGTVGLVLLIACANVANLFLVRAEGRQQELAVRTALGASWTRIARELLSESLTLAVAGGALGTGLAYAGIRLLVALKPEGLPRQQDIGIDATVLIFTLGLSLLSGLLFGLIPVVKFATPRIVNALKEGGRLSSDGRERHRARSVLVIAEVAMALVLLIGAGLMVRTFQAMRRVHPGFERPEEVLTLRISIPSALVEDGEQAIRTHEAIVRRIEQIPGVDSVGLSSSMTMEGDNANDPIFVEEFPAPDGEMPPIRRFKWISEHYFETMGRPVLAGRAITWNDLYSRAPVAMVTENFARAYWNSPMVALGKRIRQSPQNRWREIIGVVADEHDDGVAEPPPPVIYWPLLMEDFWDNELFAYRSPAYAIRSARLGSPSFLKEIQQAVWSVNASLPVASVRTLQEIQEESMARTSFALVMLAIASAAALLLGLVGIGGVIWYAASQRTREIGIRMTLGADGSSVRWLFVRHGLLLAGVGVMLGLGAAAALTRLMSALLFGVSPVDPVTYLAVACGLTAVALLASYLPAWRASRVDPVEALRWE